MKIITEEQVAALGITPEQCVDWVEQSFRSKPEADMPAKISVHPFPNSFYTAMPCYHPDTGRVGVKVVSRIPDSVPPLKSKMMLFEASSGDLTALIDTNWITAMRTGAVAALAAKTFAADFAKASFGFVGLGNIAHAVMHCLLTQIDQSKIVDIWLLKFANESERFVNDFKSFANVRFHETASREELVAQTTVLFSCVTVMHDQFLPAEAYPIGYLCVPVHVRGFQDCDIAFDRVFGDDAGQMRDWRNFNRFKEFAEFSDVLLGKKEGRRNSDERILSYNYGLALHDLWFASKIYNLLDM